MGKVVGLAHIGIKVVDFDRSLKFYTEKLGFQVDAIEDLGRVKLGFLKNGTCLLELICSETYKGGAGAGDIDHVCMEVVCIDELVASLKEKGVEFEGPVSHNPNLKGGVKNIFFKGPDGERIEFFDYMK